MPYLRVTCPALDAGRRGEIVSTLTDAVVELFTPPRGPTADQIRERTTVHFACYGEQELFIGVRPAGPQHPDVTVELSDWPRPTRQKARVAARFTPLLVTFFATDVDAVNLRFHPYLPTDFAVGGVLLSKCIPLVARLAKRSLG